MPTDNLTERKEALLELEGLTLHEHSVRRGPLSTRLLTTLRICLCTAKEIATFESGASKPSEVTSKRLEKEIYTTLKVTIESLLAELAQGENDDEPMNERDEEVLEESDNGNEKAEQEDVTETRRLALAYKARYAEVLNAAVQQANDALAKL